MFSVYKTVHPSTGIDDSVYCNFTSPHEKNLITSSANRLTVYRLVDNADVVEEKKLKFELVQSFTLYGHISCMKSCRYGNMTKDALILAFADAKLSIVQYDSFTGDLATLSIHYFEDELEREGAHYNFHQPMLRVDPNMKCAVMLIYGFKLVVIPFHEEHSAESSASNSNHVLNATIQVNEQPASDDMNKSMTNETKAAVVPVEKPTTATSSSLSSYIIDLRKLDSWLEMRIIDIEFLYGYYEPTLFILCESTMTWVGRYSVRKDTCNSVALSLNLAQKIHPIIWPVDKLPSDCLRCYAVPQPIGGVLIFAVNSLIYINQSVPAYAIALNSIAKQASNYPFRDMEHIKCTLDLSKAVFIEPNRMIVSLKAGELYILTLQTDSESLRTVRSIHIEKGPGSVIASCLSPCSHGFLFIGSRLGNSILLKYNSVCKIVEKEEEMEAIESPLEEQQTMDQTEQVMIEETKNEIEEDNGEYDELDQLLELNEANKRSTLDASIKKSKTEELVHTFDVCDVLLNIGPCGHSIAGESVGDYAEFLNSGQQSNKTFVDLVTTSGYTKNGAISVLQRSLRPEVIATFQIPDVIDLWSVMNNELAVDPDNESGKSSNSLPTYLFLTKLDSTVILQIGNEITELDKDSTSFCTKSPTVYCANIAPPPSYKNKYILQVTTSTLYLYSTLDKLPEVVIAESDSDEEDSKAKSVASDVGPPLLISHSLIDQLDSRIKSAYSVDLYVGVLTEKGTLLVFILDEAHVRFNLVANVNQLKQDSSSSFSCFSLYKDHNKGLLTKDLITRSEQSDQFDARINGIKRSEDDAQKMLVDQTDDEDELLYGQSATINQNLLLEGSNNQKETNSTWPMATEDEERSNEQTGSITYWLYAISADTGSLNIYHMNQETGIELIYTCAKFSSAPKTLIAQQPSNNSFSTLSATTSSITDSVSNQPRISSLVDSQIVTSVNINEILVTNMNQWSLNDSRPVLMAKCDNEELLVYQAFLATHDWTKGRMSTQVNYKKLSHEIILRDKRSGVSAGTALKRKLAAAASMRTKSENGGDEGQSEDSERPNEEFFSTRVKNSTSSLRSFTNIGGYSGVAVVSSLTSSAANNACSYLIFFCPRTSITAHPIWVDGPLAAFTPLQNSAITLTGFIYMTKSSYDIRLCTLPGDPQSVNTNSGSETTSNSIQVHYDAPWVLRKVQLRQTVHFLVYHEESKTYAVVTSVSEPYSKLPTPEKEAPATSTDANAENKDPTAATTETQPAEPQKDENFVLPTKSQFCIQLYSPTNDWEPLPLGKFTLNECEHVTCLKLVSLPYGGHSSGYREFLAAGTIYCYGEDVNTRGRLLLFDVCETVPEPGKPLTAIKMKVILDKEQKGPVTCLESVHGHLVGSVGQKVFIWEYSNDELMGKAFIDSYFYVHKMITIKNFVLIADLHHSIALIRFQPQYKKLSFVAKDKRKIDAYACEYLVDNSNLAFLSTDAEKNLCVYAYQSESHDNQGGCWLIRKAEFNVGSHINSMFRLKCRVNDPNLDKRSALADKRHVTYCTNLDGGIGYLIPISEKMFRRLFLLQNVIYVMKPHYAGLNPKSYRAWHSRRHELNTHQKNILDGDLLFEYFNLSLIERGEVAKKIKTSSEQLLDDLTEIFQLTCHF